ncbi:MAG: glycosyltransferase family 4 protein [Candidatus Aminicenantaceae bacterium]
MNILFISDVSIKEVIGGAERVLYEQTTRLAERANNVCIITRKLPFHMKNQEQIKNVKEFRYQVNRKNNFSFLLSSLIKSIKLFSRLNKEYNFDIINFHQPFSALGINLTKKSRLSKKIYTCLSLSFKEFEVRNPAPNKIIPRITHKINSYLRRIIEKFSISKSDLIIVLSEFTKHSLIEKYGIKPEKIHKIPGGVDLDTFKYVDDKKNVRQRLGLPSEIFLTFTVRNLVPRMGLENLICAMKKIKSSCQDIHLIIGGEGPLKLKLINLIKSLNLEKNIELTGFIPHKKLPLFYQASDFFILPTKCMEGFGLVTIEAMACGTPVLGTPVGGTKEILNGFDSSFLFEDISPQSITELILQKYKYYKKNPDMYKKLSQRSRKYVENNYSWEKNAFKTEVLFNKLINQK